MRYPLKRLVNRSTRLLRQILLQSKKDVGISVRKAPSALNSGSQSTTRRVPLSKKKPIRKSKYPIPEGPKKRAMNQESKSSKEGLEKNKTEDITKPPENPSPYPPPEQHEVPKFAAEEPPLANPFPLLAHSTENIDLASRLRSYSNNFSVIGALWCTLSITALTMAPLEDVYKESERDQTSSSSLIPHKRREGRKPVLVKYLGVPEVLLEDLYMASWSASFFASAIGLGLSTVVAGLVASTAPSYIKIFVRRHSDILIALPICQGLSSGFAAIGLTVGLDEARGEPVAWIGYIGSFAGAAIVGGATSQVLKGYKASRAAGKVQVTPPKDSGPRKA